jgi:hypothetical protein
LERPAKARIGKAHADDFGVAAVHGHTNASKTPSSTERYRFPVGSVTICGGGCCAAAARGQVGKNRRHDLPPNISEGVAVEEEKWGAAMIEPEKLYGFLEGEDLCLLLVPLACARCLSLAIKAVLRASSCSRSSVEADDKLPTPVFEKLGSGL